jgi:tripartite-type tricarboxylate transporter receptor subunit TctC
MVFPRGWIQSGKRCIFRFLGGGDELSIALRALCLVAVALACGIAQAQNYPAKPIRIIVPSTPGITIDILARLVAEKLLHKWGQPVIVENRAGAAANIGAEAVARAAPDGYTLLFSGPPPLVINKSLYAKLAYDPDTFVPVSVVAMSPSVLVVDPKIAAGSVQELIALAKANPDRLNYASGGSGTTPHLAAELFKSMTGVKIVHIPYKSTPSGLMALSTGQTDMMFIEMGAVLPYIRSGKLRALGVASDKRSALLPGVPAVAETLPGFLCEFFTGVVAPPATPSAIASKVSAAINDVLKQADVAKKLQDMNLESVGGTPADMAQFMKQERERWGNLIRAIGVTAE